MNDSLVRDRIVLGIKDNGSRKVLLQKSVLTLKTSIDICRGAEATQLQLQSLGAENELQLVNTVNKTKKTFARKSYSGYKTAVNDSDENRMSCLCGRKHKLKKYLCPAAGQTCHNCKKKDHFASKCPEKKSNVHAVGSDTDSSDDSTEYAYGVEIEEEI